MGRNPSFIATYRSVDRLKQNGIKSFFHHNIQVSREAGGETGSNPSFIATYRSVERQGGKRDQILLSSQHTGQWKGRGEMGSNPSFITTNRSVERLKQNGIKSFFHCNIQVSREAGEKILLSSQQIGQ